MATRQHCLVEVGILVRYEYICRVVVHCVWEGEGKITVQLVENHSYCPLVHQNLCNVNSYVVDNKCYIPTGMKKLAT